MQKITTSLFTLVLGLFTNLYSANSSADQQIGFADPLIAIMGRTQSLEKGAVLAGYPGVTFSTEFTGNNLKLNAHSSSDKTYIEAIVDNQPAQIFKLSTIPTDYDIKIPDGKKHQLQIISRAESWHGLVTFNSLTTNGEFTKAPPLPSRKIMVLGDSVTCASSIDRKPNVKPDTDASNPRESYGMLIAKSLNAQVHLVCMGGHGLVRTWDGFTDRLNVDEYYALTYPSTQQKVFWNQASYQPQLIISAIGTNDFNLGIPEHDFYVDTYIKFVLQLLADHKNAQIVITEGAILNGEKKAALTAYLQETLKRVADKRVHYIASNNYPGEPIDAHPTKEEHAKMAQDFVPPLKKLMSW